MDAINAPWRGKFVTGGTKEEGCFMCRIPSEDKDGENYLLYRGKLAYVILNRYPYNTGHLMVVPYTHGANLEDLEDEICTEIMTLAKKMVQVLKSAMKPDGFNLGFNLGSSAGAGVVDHIHLHIVPRWSGDTNFMPVIANTKVLPHDLETVYKLLANAL